MTTVTIEKYSTEELLNICIDKFYEELATSTKFYYLNKVREENQIRPRTRLQKRLKNIKRLKELIDKWTKGLAVETSRRGKKIFKDAILTCKDRLEREENPTIENQKKVYEKTQDVFASHTYTEFPLTGKINPLYNKINCLIIYYDNITTEEIVSKLENAPTLEEKKQIVKDNVEITHALIREAKCPRKCISLVGKMDEEYTDPSNKRSTCLPPKFADWANLTEADCEEIANKQLRRYILSKIK